MSQEGKIEDVTMQSGENSKPTKVRMCVLSEENIEKLKKTSKELNELISEMNF